jgi:hypothetical protein
MYWCSDSDRIVTRMRSGKGIGSWQECDPAKGSDRDKNSIRQRDRIVTTMRFRQRDRIVTRIRSGKGIGSWQECNRCGDTGKIPRLSFAVGRIRVNLTLISAVTMMSFVLLAFGRSPDYLILLPGYARKPKLSSAVNRIRRTIQDISYCCKDMGWNPKYLISLTGFREIPKASSRF